MVILLGLVIIGIATGCDKTHINMYDYTHKPAVKFISDESIDNDIEAILNKDRGGF